MPTANHYRSLVELIDGITDFTDRDSLLDAILQSLMGHFNTSRGLILLPNHRELLTLGPQRGLEDAPLETLPNLTAQEWDKLAPFQRACQLPLIQRIALQGRTHALLLLGERAEQRRYSEEDRDYLITVTDLAALAMDYQGLIQHLRDSIHSLDAQVAQLSSLFELSKEFSGTLDAETIGQLLVFTLVQTFRVEGFAVVGLRESPPRIIEARLPRAKLREALADSDLRQLDGPLPQATLQRRYPRLAALGVELAVPVYAFSQLRGAILLGKRRDGKAFSTMDIEFVSAVGSLAIIAVENARLFQTALEKERLEQDLQVARTIQQNLLPQTLPELPPFRLAASNQPAYQVGGDYFDVLQPAPGQLVLAIADVSGKGVHSALLMANVQAFLQALCQQPPELPEATAQLNHYVSQYAPPEMFITLFWGVLETSPPRLRFVNAGHNPPLLWRDGQTQWLDTDGLILGALDPAPPFSEGVIALQPGDRLVAYTDGVTEARNRHGALFGEEGLVATLEKLADQSAESLLAGLRSAVADFAEGAEQADDITCLVVQVD